MKDEDWMIAIKNHLEEVRQKELRSRANSDAMAFIGCIFFAIAVIFILHSFH